MRKRLVTTVLFAAHAGLTRAGCHDGHFPATRQLDNLDLHRLGVYPGSLGNYASRMLGIPVVTIELNQARELPPEAEVRQMWIDLNNWLTRYVGHMRRAADATWGDELG